MTLKCPECAGKGELYLRIAGDVHIAKCAGCDGWGTVEVVKGPVRMRKFGSVNLDDFLDDIEREGGTASGTYVETK